MLGVPHPYSQSNYEKIYDHCDDRFDVLDIGMAFICVFFSR